MLKQGICYLTLLLTLVLSGCMNSKTQTQQNATNFIQKHRVEVTTKEKYQATKPEFIAFYHQEQKPALPYKIIGIVTIAKKNILGLPRKGETINQMLKKLAASIGGNALINIKHSDDEVKAHIIAYQRILI